MLRKTLNNYNEVVGQNLRIRAAGILASSQHNLAIEVFSGQGILTDAYKKHFKNVVTNDIDKTTQADFHLRSEKFIQTIAPFYKKIDLIDFDSWGSPSRDLELFFQLTGSKHCPIIVNYSDGLGQWLKRCKREDLLRKRYLFAEEYEINMHRIWERHSELVNDFMFQLAINHNMQCEPILVEQTKNKNYTLGAYEFII